MALKKHRLGPRPLSAHFLNLLSSHAEGTTDAFDYQFPFCQMTKRSATDVEFFLKAVSRYQNLSLKPRSLSGEKIKNINDTELYLYRADEKVKKNEAIFIVPSLINKATILDLTDRRSFCQFFANKGYDVYLIEWGAPDHQSCMFSIQDYIEKRLFNLLEGVSKYVDKTHLMGFCMGGIMALLTAHQKPEMIGSLSLFACPFDFHRNKQTPVSSLVEFYKISKNAPANKDKIDIDTIQMMFLGLNPDQIFEKFGKFMDYKNHEERFEYFVAMEDWVNDGVPLSIRAADEMILGWYKDNSLFNDEQLKQKFLNTFANHKIPIGVFVAQNDKIVPKESTYSLIDLLKSHEKVSDHITVHEYDCGHTSIIAGNEAQKNVWHDYQKWLASS